MINAEWSLVFFTLLGQFSTGVLLCAFVFNLFPGTTGASAEKITRSAAKAAFVLMAIALALSFLHLSSPLSAIYALSNLQDSWLSREILMASTYAFLAFLLLLQTLYRPGNQLLQKILLPVTVLAGLAMVYTMARLYMIETVPVWNTPKTLVSFYASVLLAGSAIFMVIFSKDQEKTTVQAPKKPASILLIMTAGLFLKLFTLVIPYRGIAEANTGFAVTITGGPWMLIHWALLALGALLAIVNLQKQRTSKVVSGYYVSALLCFVLAEIIARADFYASFFRIGI